MSRVEQRNLIDFLPDPNPDPSPDAVLDAFMAWADGQGLTLYPAQEEAILELYAEKNVILNTPTGSGKSLVATALHFRSLAEGRRSKVNHPSDAQKAQRIDAPEVSTKREVRLK